MPCHAAPQRSLPWTLLFTTLLLGLVAGLCSSALADQPRDGWNVTLGAGVGSSPRYEGSKERYTSLVPVIDITYKAGSLVLSPGALLWSPIESEQYSLGAIVTFDAGRKAAQSNSRFNPGSDSLKGLGDIKATVVAGITGRVGPVSLSLLKAPGGRGHGGALGEIGLELPWAFNDRLTFAATPSVTWMDRRYANAFFGVTATQSAASGKPVFVARKGLKTAALALGARYRMDTHWSMAADASFARFGDDVSKSPIIEKRNQTGLALTVQYTF